jgi:BCD family chlorophyll transporter-like MFS transporter
MLRLALVQTALGSVVVLLTSSLNRVMIVELALPAALPAALVALHYAVQLLRPRVGYGADLGGRCTPWIIGGMALLGIGGCTAALAVAWIPSQPLAGIALAVAAYAAVGLGVGAAGTSNLVLLTKRVAPQRRAAAATLMWVMMIAGFGSSAGVAGHFLQPYSPQRLVEVYAVVGAAAFALAAFAVWNVESAGPHAALPDRVERGNRGGFALALGQLWRDPTARCFTLFLFVAMLAFSAQELLIESFAGLVFGLVPGQSAQLAGVEHGGVLTGMLSVALLGSRFSRRSIRGWMTGGTLGSAAAIAVLAVVSFLGLVTALAPVVFVLGVANGTFAVAALGAMMELSAAGGPGREGLRMGLWGASQALAFAIGGLGAGAALDASRYLWHRPGIAYAGVFSAAAALFLLAAAYASALQRRAQNPSAVADTSLTQPPLSQPNIAAAK